MKKLNRNIRVIAILCALAALWLLTSCASTRSITEKPCDLDPKLIAPGKAWMQAQDSCKNVR